MDILQKFESCYEAMRPAQESSEEAFAWFSGLPHFFFNPVMHLCCKDAEAKIDALLQAAPNEVSFWVHPENRAEGMEAALEKKGFVPALKCPLMSWDVKKMDAVSGDFKRSEEGLFKEMTGTIFSMEGTLLEEFCALLHSIQSENVILFANGKPAATGILLPNGKDGGVFNVGVLPEFRGQGLAKQMMRYLMGRAQEIGLSKLVLLSSPEMEKMYLALGFEKAFDVEIYMPSR